MLCGAGCQVIPHPGITEAVWVLSSPVTRGPQGKQMIKNDSDSRQRKIRPPLCRFAKEARRTLHGSHATFTQRLPAAFGPAAELLWLPPVCRSDPVTSVSLVATRWPEHVHSGPKTVCQPSRLPLAKCETVASSHRVVPLGKGLYRQRGLAFLIKSFGFSSSSPCACFQRLSEGLGTFKG